MNKLLFGESYTPEDLNDYQIKVIDKLEFHVNYALSFNSSPENNDHIRSWLIEAQRELPMHKEQLVCLLYTSQSPRDRQKSRMPSSA